MVIIHAISATINVCVYLLYALLYMAGPDYRKTPFAVAVPGPRTNPKYAIIETQSEQREQNTAKRSRSPVRATSKVLNRAERTLVL